MIHLDRKYNILFMSFLSHFDYKSFLKINWRDKLFTYVNSNLVIKVGWVGSNKFFSFSCVNLDTNLT